MKHLFLFLAFVTFFGTQLPAQVVPSLEDPAMDDYFNDQSHIPKITGRFVHFNTNDLKEQIVNYTLVVPFAKMQTDNETVQVAPDGTFEIKLSYLEPYQQIWLNIGNIYFSEIIANKDLHIETDIALLKQDTFEFWGKGVTFSGSDAAINEMVNRFYFENRDQINEIQSGVMAVKKEVSMRYPKMQEADKALANLEKEFLSVHPCADGWLLANARKADYYADILALHYQTDTQMEGSLLQELLAFQPAVVDNAGITFYKNLGFYLERFSKRGILEGIDYAGISPRKAELVLMTNGSRYPEEVETYFKNIANRLNSSWVKSSVEQELKRNQVIIDQINTEIINATVPTGGISELGQPVAAFSFHADLYQSGYSSADSLIAGIRAAYPGQAIILDIWATWCAPCVQDMKESADKKKAMEGLPVKIVYLCVNKGASLEIWMKKIAEIGSSGTHIFLDKPLSKDLMKSFGLNAYPTYLLIDKDGKVHKDLIPNIANLDLDMLKRFL
jgi:thiol-disulfide isomerase/thioredoxin